MSKHPFRLAIESGANADDFRKLFAADAVIYAPMLTKPVMGAPEVLNIVSNAARISGPITYTLEVRDSRQTFLFWKGHAGSFTLEAVTILVDGEDGLIREVRVLMRPWPIVTIFRDAMHKALSASIPADFWELQPKPASDGTPRKFTPIALKPIALASDMVLHSPMLARSVSGRAEVEAAVGLAHQIQSASSYTSITATPNLLIELFDCDADGYPMEGIWMQISKPNCFVYLIQIQGADKRREMVACSLRQLLVRLFALLGVMFIVAGCSSLPRRAYTASSKVLDLGELRSYADEPASTFLKAPPPDDILPSGFRYRRSATLQ